MNNEQKKIETTFALERRFPDVKRIFTVYEELDTQSDNLIYVLDTNVLLLPYKNAKIGAKQMEEIKSILTDLKNSNKLYIPERVIREFASNHGENISNLISNLNNKNSIINFPIIEFPKILQDHELFNELNFKGKEIKEKIEVYKKDYKKLVEDIKAWKGNDPIKAIYNDLFDQDNIEPCPDSEEDLIKEWEVRLLTKRPPGYKDKGKDDSGIGDFIIWKTIIGLANKYNKDIIFVTGEQKNDWFVRGNNEALFMRPELSNEFSDLTNGKKIALQSFDSMLSFYKASDNLIEEIVQAEKNINNDISTVNVAEFDYSTNNGRITLTDISKKINFTIMFSKANDTSIHIYNDGLAKVGRIKDKPPLSQFRINEYDTSSRSYTIRIGEAFFAVDYAGNVLSGRIKQIKDDSRNAESDYVKFVYEIFSPNEKMFTC